MSSRDITSTVDERTASDSLPRNRSGSEEGSALAISLIAILVITVLATAGYSMSNFELDTSRDFRAGTEAFYVADRGLNRYLATDADDLDTTVVYQFQEGTATVTPEPVTMGMQNNEELHRVTSVGEHVTPEGETVQRTVSTVLLATPMLPVMPNGAFVAGNTLNQNGNAQYDGYNGYDPTGGTGDALCEAAGVQEGGSIPGITADTFHVSGGSTSRCESDTGVTPDAQCIDDPVDQFMSPEQWGYMRDTMQADHVINDSDPFPETDGWEVVKIEGGTYNRDAGARNGKGILIVEGNFFSNGNFSWDGLVLIGGKFGGSQGQEDIEGSIVTGLNELLGENVPDSNVGNGTKEFKYDSCNLYKATRAKYRVSKVPSSWYEVR